MHKLGALDHGTAASIHAQSFAALGERGWTQQDVAELMASPGVVGWLVDDVGVALGRLAADEAELLTIAVLPAHRRKGIARDLLHQVIAWARVSGARTLFLEVGDDNPGAWALYDSEGFVVVGNRKGYYQRHGAPADAMVMRLNLS